MKRIISAFSAVAILGLAAQSLRAEDGMLTIGDVAPPLAVEHWVQDNGGELKPVDKFEAGKVYVVEFWSTWCGPCISSMPHLAETQEKYGYEKLRLISISDEDLDTVTEFLDRVVRGEDEKTYKELTKGYSLTTDPDRSVFRAYMEAAAQNGIPTAFLVGKSGIVEWIGHPMSMDEPLEQVINDEWDRDAFAETFKKEQAPALLIAKIGKLLRGSDESKAEALPLIEEAIEASTDEFQKMQLGSMKLMALIGLKKYDEIAVLLQKSLDEAGDDLNSVMQASQNLTMLPPEFDDEKRAPLVASAVEKVDALLASDAIADDKDMQARIRLVLGQIYVSAKQKDKALEQFRMAKESTTMENLAKYVDGQIKTLEMELSEGDK